MDQRLSGTRAEPAASGEPPEVEAEYVKRFAVPSRLAHWLLGAPFLLLLLTGLTNFVPRLKAQQFMDERLFAWLHTILGLATVAAIVLLVLPLLATRSVRADLRELTRVGRDDYLWLQHVAFVASGARSRLPPVGKFNAGQKINALLSFGATAGLMVTGIVLGVNFITKEIFPIAIVEDLFRLHTLLSLLVIPLVLGHLYLALLHPSTRESMRAITFGVVRRDWAARHHDAWIAKPRADDERP